MLRCLLMICAALSAVSALKLPAPSTTTNRRQALTHAATTTLAAAAAPLFSMATPLPASARSKASVAPNKVEGTGANAGAYLRDQYKSEYAAMAGDKGSRGVASANFEKNDTVQKNRKQNGGLARDATGRKIVKADRNRDPAELGLKQWDGS